MVVIRDGRVSFYNGNINLLPGYWDGVYEQEVVSNNIWRLYREKFAYISSKIKNKSEVLEIGCGVGVLQGRIKKDHPDVSLYGVDISEYAVRYCLGRGFNVKQGIVPGVFSSYPDNSMDYVIGCEILEHMDSVERSMTIKESHRILKSGGSAIFSVPDNSLPPEEIREHRACFDSGSFRSLISSVFGDVDVCSFSTTIGGNVLGWHNFLIAEGKKA